MAINYSLRRGIIKARNYATAVVMLIAIHIFPLSLLADQILADFNGTGFTYTFSGFNQTLSADSVRLNDPLDGWGGAGLDFSTFDLSALANDHLSVDVIRESGHQTEDFKLELFDTSGNTGKWTFDSTSLNTGQSTNLIASNTLANPESGIGSLDLSQINRLQVIGDFSSILPFNMSFDQIAVTDQVSACDPYCGWQSDAAWRTEANTRIEANRKADLAITVVDAAGVVVPNASVHAAMQNHEFEFGTAVQVPRINGSSSANATYRQKLLQYFNAATFENAHKWPFWEGDNGSIYEPDESEDAKQWLAARDFPLRGHAQVWPGYNFLPDFIQTKVDEYSDSGTSLIRQQELADEMRQDVLDHIAEIGSATAGEIKYWDVLNEPRVNDLLMDILGEAVIVDWFNAARAQDANAKLFVNDYNILNSHGGTINAAEQQAMLDTIAILKNAGAPIDGVGLQAHFSDSSLTAPEDVWSILDQFDAAVDNVHITEFDVDTGGDEALQGQYFRDFLIAAFAHEGVDAFSVWGFWEEAVFISNRAMFRSDWSIKPNGQAWIDLVFGEWWTDETVDVDANGEATISAFRGDYEVSADYQGVTTDGVVQVDADGESIIIQLTTLLGDFNADGIVDAADYTVWRDNFGLADESAINFSGDGGSISLSDYDLWRDNYGNSALISIMTTSVPEPSTMFGIMCFSLLTLLRQKHFS